MDIEPRLVTIPEAARLLALSRARVYTLVRRGELKSILIGRSRRVSMSAIDEFIDEHSLGDDMVIGRSRPPPHNRL